MSSGSARGALTASAQPIGVVLTYNEAVHIAACIRSLQRFLRYVVVVDSGSDDGTVEVARLCGAAVIQRPFVDYASQRQAALDALRGEWILFIDADERVPPALGAEIAQLCRAGQAQPRLAGARLPRRNCIVAGVPSWGGFHPDWQLRLLRRARASFRGAEPVHETAAVQGQVRDLRCPLWHYNYDSWRQFHVKQWRYARYAARRTDTRDPVPGWALLTRFLRLFRYRYVQLAGWRDGALGLRLAVWLAWYYGVLPYALALGARRVDREDREV